MSADQVMKDAEKYYEKKGMEERAEILREVKALQQQVATWKITLPEPPKVYAPLISTNPKDWTCKRASPREHLCAGCGVTWPCEGIEGGHMCECIQDVRFATMTRVCGGVIEYFCTPECYEGAVMEDDAEEEMENAVEEEMEDTTDVLINMAKR